VESAVKEANSQLNDVAQNIRYIGLSADEIRAIMKETEAEQTLQTTRDNTQSRNMLEQIESLIRSPENFVSESSGNTIDFSDLTFDPNADPLDMFNLTGNTNSSFSNLRGTELYNAAKQRCQNLLNSCGSRGANVSQVQGRYDMEIDKDCINYEKGLVKMNDTLRSNVRSATQMLQKARLEVLNNQNQFDAKGCIGALETCMKDDMVCGGDYTKCLDPTKKYIDESGSVILGQNISTIRNMMNSYDNSLIDSNFVSSAWGMSGYPDCEGSNSNGKCIVKYLLSKIGMGESATSGLCRPVLDKCRRLTYDTRGKYDPKNSVVVGYVQRAMTNIRAAQENIISDYASSCMADIATCYSKQVTQINAWSSNANVQNVYSVLKGACRNVALTCSYAVFAADQSENGCPISSPQTQSNEGVCIENISDIFYQSMLCPDYSFWVPAQSGAMTGTMYPYSPETPTMVHVNERCVCQEGYGVNAGRCEICPTGSGFNQNCTAADGHTCLITGCSRCPGAEKYIYTPATQTYVCGTCPDGTAYINGQCI
jgi:hypothetical protein